MKPHRQIRTSKVSSETGVAITDTPSRQRYKESLDQIVNVLQSMPHSERQKVLVDAYKSVKG